MVSYLKRIVSEVEHFAPAAPERRKSPLHLKRKSVARAVMAAAVSTSKMNLSSADFNPGACSYNVMLM